MAYSANGNEFPSKTKSRVRYKIDYDSGTDLYSLPKSPELIKIANSVALNVFFDSTSDYTPIPVDITALTGNYGDQIFFDVTNEKNMVFVDTAVTGDCLTEINEFVNYIP